MGLLNRSSNVTVSFGPVTPAVKWLLIVNTGLFVVYFFLFRAGLGAPIEALGLAPRDVLTGFAFWQPFTYMFIHSATSLSHILFNMLALYMFGSPIEQSWGSRRFLRYYFICGLGAAVFIIVLNLLFGSPDTRTIGASGAVYGLLLAFGVLFPNQVVLFAFIFPMKAKYFVMIIGAIVFFNSIGDAGGGVSHFAHLGGMVVGWLYLRSGMVYKSPPRLAFSIEQLYKEWKLRRAKKKFQVYLRKKDPGGDRWTN